MESIKRWNIHRYLFSIISSFNNFNSSIFYLAKNLFQFFEHENIFKIACNCSDHNQKIFFVFLTKWVNRGENSITHINVFLSLYVVNWISKWVKVDCYGMIRPVREFEKSWYFQVFSKVILDQSCGVLSTIKDGVR